MVMRTPGPPVVSGQFEIIAEGLPATAANKVKVPQLKALETSMGSAGAPLKVNYPSGLGEIDGMLEVEAFDLADNSTREWILDWMRLCVNQQTGRTGISPEAAKRSITVISKDGGGNEVSRSTCVGCFPIEPGAIEHEALKPDAVMLSMKFKVDRVD